MHRDDDAVTKGSDREDGMEMMEGESERRFVLVHTEKMRVGSLHACMHPMYISIADCLVLAKVEG